MESNMAERVAYGIEILDKAVADWRDRVNLDELQMDGVSQCILGQVFGYYLRGVESLGLDREAQSGAGFDLTVDEYRSERPAEHIFWDLQGAWRDALTAPSDS